MSTSITSKIYVEIKKPDTLWASQRKNVIVGAGLFSRSMIPLFNLEYSVLYIHDKPRFEGEEIDGFKVMKCPPSKDLLYIAPIGDCRHKRELVKELPGVTWMGLIHLTAIIVKTAEVGEGAVIQPYSLIYDGAKVGKHLTMNGNANIGHHSQIGNYCWIGPNAVICGNSIVGEGVEIGAGATILPKINVGNGSRIGAGAIVTKDIPPNQIWAGVPAQHIRSLEEW